jgi:7,8-dihydropterin-6-yl-methyl-4-(beta-D-ribofuranosyl)aminobenzene 5'-phosphate synthase
MRRDIEMKLTIVYDNEVYRKDIGLKSDWGFSCLIEANKTIILFDTGAKSDILLSNMQKLSINPMSIDKIVISHEHWDHNGGLNVLATIVDDADLYRLSNQNTNENMHLISAEEPLKITEGVYTTGRLKGSVDEQSLVIKGGKGWYVLTGCSHPGLEKILPTAKKIGNIVGIIGGFHGFNNFNLLENLGLICPCHCTSHKKDLEKIFPDKISKCGVGKIIKLDE